MKKETLTLTSGSINVYDYSGVKLHAYFTNDPLADVAYIVEGKKALAGIELPLLPSLIPGKIMFNRSANP